jgi:ATP-binding cassette, subfamily B (MDR/TAP), member 1
MFVLDLSVKNTCLTLNLVRVAIARALVRKPRVLILDEATSALDGESEAKVQEAIQSLMQSREQTVLVIAHRLSTIRHADRIALVADGRVLECGSHEDLMRIPQGRYRRLIESSKRRSTLDSVGLRSLSAEGDVKTDEPEAEINWEDVLAEEETKAFSASRARRMARPDAGFLLIGAVGALLTGGIFPMWGLAYSQTLGLLFTPVVPCPLPDGVIPAPLTSCEDYWSSTADYMQHRSYVVAGYWGGLVVVCIVGHLVQFYGFGYASDRLNKRIRDMSFLALLQQEVAFFDKRGVGSLLAQLQDDAARIHAFSGEPVRTLVTALASAVIGVALAFAVRRTLSSGPGRQSLLLVHQLTVSCSTCGRSRLLLLVVSPSLRLGPAQK